MIRTTRHAIIGLAFAFGLSACRSGADLPVRVASLPESLPNLERAAIQWRPDAYMVDANIQLLSDQPFRSSMNGYFQSPSTDFEGILVYLEQDGSITTELVPHENEVRQVAPITNEDWQLDAAEALDRALNTDSRAYLENNADSQCSFMILERDVPDSPERVIWRVQLGGCLLDPPFQRIVIDANTGEILERRTY